MTAWSHPSSGAGAGPDELENGLDTLIGQKG
jgi:hypothetical protein